MAKLKVPRKSTSIDMTAMCDVAFLLLSFFIFTAKMKKNVEIEVENPTSVSTDTIAVKNKFNVTVNIGKEGQILMGLDTDTLMEAMAKEIDSVKGIGFTPGEIEAFKKRTSVGMDFKDMKSYFATAATGKEMPPQVGIPMSIGADTTMNQLNDWIDIVAWRLFYKAKASNNQIADPFPTVYINADKKAPYAVVDKVLTTFAKKNLDKFKLVTTPEDVPIGTALDAELKKSKK
jgi:biopolymer transport protein ExbD